MISPMPLVNALEKRIRYLEQVLTGTNQLDMQSERKPVEEYSQSSSCHGLSYILNRQSGKLRRYIWLFVYLLSIGAMLYFLTKSSLVYLAWPSVTTIKYILTDSLQYPAVTVCNYNQVRRSYYEERVQNGTLMAFWSLEEFVQQKIDHGNITVVDEKEVNATTYISDLDDESYWQLEDWYYDEYNRLNWEDLIMEGGHQLEHIFPLGDIMVLGDTSFANDIIFLYGKSLPTKVRTFIYPSFNVLCHTLQPFTDKEYQNPAFANVSSPSTSLTIDLNLEPEEYPDSITPSMLVGVHPPNKLPHFSQFTNVYGRALYDISVEKLTRKILGTPYNDDDCYEETTLFPCSLACIGKAIARTCGCRLEGWPRNDVPLCNIDANTSRCYAELQEVRECRDCLADCKTDTYNFKTFVLEDAYYKSDPGLTGLIIYFNDYAYTEMEQSPSYPASQLFGDIGGTLGLFLGASLLTFGEIVDLILVGIFSKCN